MMDEPAIGLERAAADGYDLRASSEHLGRFELQGWDLNADETMRFTHLNGPQFFRHAWVHRTGPISHLRERVDRDLGTTQAATPLGLLTLDDWIEGGPVDGYLVLHHGDIVYERYPRMRPFDKHHWWSTRKALVGAIVAILEGAGRVDVDAPVETYVSGLADTAWHGVPVIDVLDMASGTAAVEVDDPAALTDDTSPYYRYESTVGNRPSVPGVPASTYEYVAGLPRHRPNGEAYEYTTVNTFVLTWLVEEVAERPFPEAISELVWRRIGAESDAVTMVSHTGASSTINSTLRDLGRFGMLYTPSWSTVTSDRLITDRHLDKLRNGGRPEIFARAGAGRLLNELLTDDPPAHNTYQWDFVMPDGDMFKGGHNGQGLYISPDRDLVIAFFGSGDDGSIFTSMKLARSIALTMLSP